MTPWMPPSQNNTAPGERGGIWRYRYYAGAVLIKLCSLIISYVILPCHRPVFALRVKSLNHPHTVDTKEQPCENSNRLVAVFIDGTLGDPFDSCNILCIQLHIVDI